MKQLYGDIRLVLQCIQKSPFSSDILNDEIIMSAIKVLASQTREVSLFRCIRGLGTGTKQSGYEARE